MSGPYISEMGDVITSSLKINTDMHEASAELRNNFRLEIGQIESIYTVDDKQNNAQGNPGAFTVYDVMVHRQNGATELIPRCRMLQPSFGGGINNFLEVLPTDSGSNGKDSKVSAGLKRGHFVLVGFIGGRKDSPVILGAMPHTNKVAVAKRPKKGKGTHFEGEIQGVNFQIDNDGSLKVTQQSPKKDDGTPSNEKIKTTIHVQKDGSIEITTNEKQKVRIDSQTKHIRIDNGNTYVDMDQTGDKIDVVAKNVNVGTGGLQPQVVGDDMVKWCQDLCQAIMELYVPTGVGPSGTPVNSAKFAQLKSTVKDRIQSKKHKVEK